MSLTITRKVTVSGGTVLRAANNLGDVASASASRGNLGFATTTTDNAVVRFDGVTGQTQNSGVTIDDSGKLMASPTLTGSSGTVSGAKVGSTINQSGTAGYDVLLVDASTAAAGSGSKYLIRATTGDSVTQFSVDNSGNTATTGNLTVSGTGTSTFAGPVQLNGAGNTIKGTTTNDNAATGCVGEYVESTVAGGSAVSLTTGTATNVTSISLGAGDWDVSAIVAFNEVTTLTGFQLIAGISTVSATRAGWPTEAFSPAMPSSASNITITPARRRLSLSGTTTVYLIAQAAFSAGSISTYGHINARRVR